MPKKRVSKGCWPHKSKTETRVIGWGRNSFRQYRKVCELCGKKLRGWRHYT